MLSYECYYRIVDAVDDTVVQCVWTPNERERRCGVHYYDYYDTLRDLTTDLYISRGLVCAVISKRLIVCWD